MRRILFSAFDSGKMNRLRHAPIHLFLAHLHVDLPEATSFQTIGQKSWSSRSQEARMIVPLNSNALDRKDGFKIPKFAGRGTLVRGFHSIGFDVVDGRKKLRKRLHFPLWP
jgi:hypothetical protein